MLRRSTDPLGILISGVSLTTLALISYGIWWLLGSPALAYIAAMWAVGVPIDTWARRANRRRLERAAKRAFYEGAIAEAERRAELAEQHLRQRQVAAD